MNDRLGSAEWADASLIAESYAYSPGSFWLGRSMTRETRPVGYTDDRHICLVSGSRSGKGASTIIGNLCLWPGSVVVIDPKGENASVTAARRGRGSAHAEGMGQAVHVLDPFGAATVPDDLRSRFNPLDALDPNSDESIDEAGRIADALVVVREGSKDPFWDESARSLVKGIVLHVLTCPDFDGRRNLITVRDLITRGDWEMAETLRQLEAEKPDEEKLPVPDAQTLLWTAIRMNEAFDGVVSGIGATYLAMLGNSPKQFESVIQVANRSTEFIDSPGMRRSLVASDFKLSDIKAAKEGVSVYLCLPARFMNTHYRWLRMLVSLIISEMEIVKVPDQERPIRRIPTATGFPVLMVLDEFAGLKRMEIIENAVAQIAGYGVRLFFVLQSLEQLKSTYRDNWETFLANSGLKIFFGIEDHFTRDYVAKLAGETEILRETRTRSEGESEGTSETIGSSMSWSIGRNQSTSTNRSTSTNQGINSGTSGGESESENTGTSGGTSTNTSWSRGGGSSENFERGFLFGRRSTGAGSNSRSWSKGGGTSENSGWNRGRGSSRQSGWTRGTTYGTGTATGTGTSQGTNTSETKGTSSSTTTNKGRNWSRGVNESVHKRPLINPDEIGRLFSRIDDPDREIYPGLALVLITGALPAIVQRQLYYEDPFFLGKFDPHPDHGLREPNIITIETPDEWVRYLLDARVFGRAPRTMEVRYWHAKPGELVSRYQIIGTIVGVRDEKHSVSLRSPLNGVVSEIPGQIDSVTIGGPAKDPKAAELVRLRYYDLGENLRTNEDPFAELKWAARGLHWARQGKMFWLWCIVGIAAFLNLCLLPVYVPHGILAEIMIAELKIIGPIERHAPWLLQVLYRTWQGATLLAVPALAVIVYLWRKERLYPA